MGILTEEQTNQVYEWIRLGFKPQQIAGLAANQGFEVKPNTVYKRYIPKVKQMEEDRLKNNPKAHTWFDKRFRAERAAEMAEMLYGEIMDGKMFAEEVTEKEVLGGMVTTRKPVYFAGMIKNWTDLVNVISSELGQKKQTVDVNYNKNENVNISVLIDKIYEEDDSVQKQLEGAEIIDIPSTTDFSDDKAYMSIVNDQTSDDVRLLTDNLEDEDEDGDTEFPF